MSTEELQKGIDELLENTSQEVFSEKGSAKYGLSSLLVARIGGEKLEFQINNSGEWHPSLEGAIYSITPEGIKARKLKKAQELETKAAKLRMEVNG